MIAFFFGFMSLAIASNTPPLLLEVEKNYAKHKTLVATFKQTTVTQTKKSKVSEGIVEVLRPSSFRWETLKPNAQLLVSDGKQIWYFTPPVFEDEKGEWMVKKTAEVQTELLNSLLSGSFSAAKGARIIKHPKLENAFIFFPKPASAGTVHSAEVHIDPKSKIITKVIIEHVGGNRAEVALSEIKLGKSIDSARFKFIPPAGSEQIKD
jgi:outer membrane lipoprotein carrier protein